MAIASGTWHVASGLEPQAASVSAGKALLLRATPGPNGPQISVEVVDRGEVNKDRFVDTTGLRLWVDNTDSLKLIRAQIADRGGMGIRCVWQRGTQISLGQRAAR